jgi:TldD protein
MSLMITEECIACDACIDECPNEAIEADMLPRDWTFEEILEEARDGIYVTARGAGGGEVDPGMGTFTFNVGVSYRIRNGELSEPLRGVNIAGQILETLKKVVAVGRDLRVTTGAVFGGCGKSGQLVRVGDGGPHVLVEEMSVGGR